MAEEKERTDSGPAYGDYLELHKTVTRFNVGGWPGWFGANPEDLKTFENRDADAVEMASELMNKLSNFVASKVRRRRNNLSGFSSEQLIAEIGRRVND